MSSTRFTVYNAHYYRSFGLNHLVYLVTLRQARSKLSGASIACEVPSLGVRVQHQGWTKVRISSIAVGLQFHRSSFSSRCVLSKENGNGLTTVGFETPPFPPPSFDIGEAHRGCPGSHAFQARISHRMCNVKSTSEDLTNRSPCYAMDAGCRVN